MGDFFVRIYDLFLSRKPLLWLILIATTITMAVMAIKVNYVEDITNFFPKGKQNISMIFDNLKAKDKFVIMFSSKDEKEDADRMISNAKAFAEIIEGDTYFTDNANLILEVNDSLVETISKFVYDYLPVLMDDDSYRALDSITQKDAVVNKMQQNYNNLLSPMGGYISDFVYNDPLGLSSNILKELQGMGNNFSYKIIDNYIFSADKKVLICHIEPNTKVDSKKGKQFVDIIEGALHKVQSQDPNLIAEYFGVPAVAAYNAAQIKNDSMITLNIAILIVVIFITFAFRNKYTIVLVLVPVIYGALFALSMIYIFYKEISLIAVGSGSIIFGIALSYSIHILSHTNHSKDVRQLIRDLAYPLTIGSFTTIGAFVGLMFTNSSLLQDFGLFSSLTLVGTTLFALIFLPHFLTLKQDDRPDSKLLVFVEYLSNVRLDRNKPLLFTIIILTLIAGLFFNKVSFDSDLMKLNYEVPHLKKTEEKLAAFTGIDSNMSNILFIASSNSADKVAVQYGQMCDMLDSLLLNGKIHSYASIKKFVVSDSIQIARLKKWREFWTEQKRSEVISLIDSESSKLGFDDGAFMNFETMISKNYSKLSYLSNSPATKFFSDWISPTDSLFSMITQVKLSDDSKSEIYEHISSNDNIIAADRAFFASKMVASISQDFYLILYICGFLIFFALLLSYGRLELTLISFMPMFISWILILGIMSIFGIEFNIVTIILSAFIFGIGDDFSIFIMEGLQSEYRDKSQVLARHKTAIFFSAFTIIIGMGALIFAKHPAMHSLGIVSLVGIIVVVLVAYTIQPFVFRAIISSQTVKGGFPYTLLGFLNTVYAFGLFVSGCLVIQLIISLLYLMPIGRVKRKYIIHGLTSWSTRTFLKVMITSKRITINDSGETFEKPSVIIANHQSFIDILVLLGLHRKFVMVTNGWVWNSPFFGRIVRYLDFYHTADGYEQLAESLKEKIKQGYSVIVFPEGTRSSDNNIKRFHKGAFYLAEQLKLDITPILLYGNGLVLSKQQIYVKKGLLVSKILPRITFESKEYGDGYKERSKSISIYFKEEYEKLYQEYNRASNPYFRDAIIKNYIYKGAVLEWYMRVKLSMEKWYDKYDRILPRNGTIVDLGCGYGAMSYMLLMLSNKRRIIGVDYDEDKIALANNCFAKSEDIEFIHSDIRKYDIPHADAYLISDVLHYIDRASQNIVIQKCIDRLNKDGKIIIRDGDSSLTKRHLKTEQSEKWSTKIMKFNKTDGEMCFLSKGQIIEIAEANSMEVDIVESDTRTSNTMFILTKK